MDVSHTLVAVITIMEWNIPFAEACQLLGCCPFTANSLHSINTHNTDFFIYIVFVQLNIISHVVAQVYNIYFFFLVDVFFSLDILLPSSWIWISRERWQAVKHLLRLYRHHSDLCVYLLCLLFNPPRIVKDSE